MRCEMSFCLTPFWQLCVRHDIRAAALLSLYTLNIVKCRIQSAGDGRWRRSPRDESRAESLRLVSRVASSVAIVG